MKPNWPGSKVADLDGRLTVERLADHLSALADATLILAIVVSHQQPEHLCVMRITQQIHLPLVIAIGFG